MPLRYAISPSCLGSVLIASGQAGLCATFIDDARAPLLASLQRRFPGIPLEPDPAGLHSAMNVLLEWLDHPAGMGIPRPPLPLDLRGSPFQQRVWRALFRIPCGQTRSYGQIAQAIGSSGASRAVGAACACNRLALWLPCHRVIAANGALGGYAWGQGRKQWLLERECQA